MTETTSNHADRYTFVFEDAIAAMREVLSIAKRLQDANPTAQPEEIVVALSGAVKLKLAKLEANYLKLSPKQRETLYAMTNAQDVLPEVAAILRKSAVAEDDTIEAREAKLAEATAKRKAAAAKSKATREAKAKKGEPSSEEEAAVYGDMFADA